MGKFFRETKLNYSTGKSIILNNYHLDGDKFNHKEFEKTPSRTEVINFLLSINKSEKKYYLEIGVRNPNDNFNAIKAQHKFSVDPGIEHEENPVDFKLSSDDFFNQYENNDKLKGILFDVIFIDGLHLAEQVDRDIKNSLKYLKSNGFIVVHDCNPPTEFHAREQYLYTLSPAGYFWNGTVWKSFYKNRLDKNISCCCIDSDWGIGIISKNKIFDYLHDDFNPFLEYYIFNEKRIESLNLISFDEFKKIILSK